MPAVSPITLDGANNALIFSVEIFIPFSLKNWRIELPISLRFFSYSAVLSEKEDSEDEINSPKPTKIPMIRIKTMAIAKPCGTFFFCNHIMGWAQIILMNRAISKGVTIDAPYITPAMMMMNAAKLTAIDGFGTLLLLSIIKVILN
jgi:hypothetical protein